MGKKKRLKGEKAAKAERKIQPANKNFIFFCLGLIFLLSFFAYFNSFHNDFVFDDRTTVIDEASIRRLQDLMPIVGTPYRPLVRLTFAINYALGGINTFVYHIVNFLFHLGVCFLLFFIFNRLLFTLYPEAVTENKIIKYLPLAGALLFALHPVNTEAVTYISSRSSLICGFFFFLAFYLYISEKSVFWVFLAFLFSLSGKEISASLPLVLLLYDTVIKKKTLIQGLKSTKWFFLPLGALVIYKLVSGGLESLYTDGALNTTRTLHEHIITQLSVVATYFRLMFLPINLTLDYDYQRSSLTFILGSLILLGLVLAVPYFKKKAPLLSFASGFTLFNLLTVTGPILFDSLFEHHLYLVLPGVVLFVLGLAAVLVADLSPEKLKILKPALALVLALVSLLMIYGCITRNRDWRDELTIWADCAKKAPAKARPHGNYGNALKERQLFEQAEREYKRALEINPQYSDVMTSLGALFLDQNRLQEAEKWLLQANEMRSKHYLILYNLGLLYGKMNKFPESEKYYKQSLEINPHYALTWNNLGNIYGRRGDIPEAEKHYKKAIEERYYMGEAHNNLGSVYANQEKYDDALREFEKALDSKPPYIPALFNLGKIYQLKGDNENAGNFYQKFLNYAPNHPLAPQAKEALEALPGKQ